MYTFLFRFNIITFERVVDTWKEGEMMDVRDQTVEDAINHVQSIPARGGSNLILVVVDFTRKRDFPQPVFSQPDISQPDFSKFLYDFSQLKEWLSNA